MLSQPFDKTPLWRALILLTLGLGMALRLWLYFANPSIWVDEAALARNILDRSTLQLFQPLDYGQVAPPGFLLGVHLSAILFGITEYALRLLPLLSGLLSVVIFYFVAGKLLRPVAVLTACLMFSLAIPLLVFSANLKQYSSDVAITLGIVWLCLHLRQVQLTPRRTIGLALAAALLLFGSQAAVFPLAAGGAVVCIDAFATGRRDRWLRLGLVAAWALAVMLVVAYGIVSMNSVTDLYMHRFWTHAFMPDTAGGAWLWGSLRHIFGDMPGANVFDGSLHYAWSGFFASLLILGGIALCLTRPADGALLLGPLLLVILASSIHLFPFGTRVSLFLLPLLLLTVVAGIDLAGQWLLRHPAGNFLPLLLLPFAITAFVRQPLPHAPEHLRPVMQHIAASWQPGDSLWVYYGAGQAFEYYRKMIPLAGDIHIGQCDRAEPRAYLLQVDSMRQQPRAWILMAHGSGAFGYDERRLIIDYLDRIGHRLDEFHAPPDELSGNRAAVMLFDLSDRQKLASTSAERFPVSNDRPPQTWACYGTMSPLGPSEKTLQAVMDWKKP
ncbi:MAG: hypothetical protein WAV95_18370 [Azonexus sp.]